MTKAFWMAPLLAVSMLAGECADSELVYDGRYWEVTDVLAPDGMPTARGQFERCQEETPAQLDEAGIFFDLEVQMDISCEGEPLHGFVYGSGPHSVRVDGDDVRFDYVVFAGRDGVTFVDGFDWADYQDADPPVPDLTGTLQSDGSILSTTDVATLIEPGETDNPWHLKLEALQTGTPCAIGALAGTVDAARVAEMVEVGADGLCDVTGQVVLAPLPATERNGEIWIDLPNDGASTGSSE